jgi:hypothetical protein
VKVEPPIAAGRTLASAGAAKAVAWATRAASPKVVADHTFFPPSKKSIGSTSVREAVSLTAGLTPTSPHTVEAFPPKVTAVRGWTANVPPLFVLVKKKRRIGECV